MEVILLNIYICVNTNTKTHTMKNVNNLTTKDLKQGFYGLTYCGYCLSKVARNYFRVYLSSITSGDYNGGICHATGCNIKEKSILFDTVKEAEMFLEKNKGISSFKGYEIERITIKIK